MSTGGPSGAEDAQQPAKSAVHEKLLYTKQSSVRFSSTCFFGRDCQNVAGGARAQTVGGKNAEVVGLGWTQVHQSQLGQLRVQDLSDDCCVPGG